MKAGLAWAKEVYKHLVDNQGQTDIHAQEQQDEPPICAVHHIAMVKQRGKYGTFWSCHQRTEDGSFCSYKPEER